MRVIPTRESLAGMVITHDGRLLVAVGQGRFVFLDVARAISGEGEPVLGTLIYDRSAVSALVNVTGDDRYVFVSDENAQSITVLDLAQARMSNFSPAAVVGSIPVGRIPVAVTFSPDHKFLYSTSETALASDGWPNECNRVGTDPTPANPVLPQGVIHVVDVERAISDPANAVIAKAPAGCDPVRLAISPQGDFVYVTARMSNELLVFDTRKLTEDPEHARVATVPVGVAPVGVDVADSGRLIFVANSNRFLGGPDDKQTLTVIDAARVREGAAAVLGTVPAGAFPRNVYTTADGRTILVTNFRSNTLELIDVTQKPWSLK